MHYNIPKKMLNIGYKMILTFFKLDMLCTSDRMRISLGIEF